MTVIIKKAETEEELDIVQDMTTYAFEPSPVKERDKSIRKYNKNNYIYLLYDNEIPVSTLDSIPMTQNVRGKIFKMQGIAGVATHPEERKKGYSKELIKYALTQAQKADFAFSTLYPFRQSFYAKFGYITFPHIREMIFNPSNLQDILKAETKGEITRVHIKNNIDRFYSFLKNYQESKHGMGLFEELLTQSLKESNYWIAFFNVNGNDEGMMVFKTSGFEKELTILEMLYTNVNAKYSLLKYIATHTDQFVKVRCKIFADETPENWGNDFKLSIKSRDVVPSTMGRILDISKIGGMKVGEGSLSIEVEDKYAPWNTKIWQFTSSNGILEVKESESAELKMNINGLSAIIYGGHSIDDFQFKGWAEMNDMQKQKLITLFPNKTPTLYEQF